MSILYVTEQGATVTKSGERILVRKDGQLLLELPAIHVEQIVVFGNAQFTTPAVNFVLHQGIDVAYLSSHGTYRGRLQHAFAKDASLRRAQYEHAGNPDFCLALAKGLVGGKIHNSLVMAQRQRQRDAEVKAAIQQLRQAQDAVQNASDLDAVRGHEGSSAAAYFRVFRKALRQDLGFRARRHRPPPDPVNVLLSLGYTLLYNQTFAAINVVGLDPYMGFFHQTHHGHATLASDLMEEWRALLVDSVVLGLINRQEVTASEFHTQKGRVRLSDAGRATFLRAYDARLRSEVTYAPTQQRVAYRRCIELQVRQLARVLTHQPSNYEPFKTR